MKYLKLLRYVAATTMLFMFSELAFSQIPHGYKATPFQDSVQQIPGRFYVWRYDSAEARGISWQTPRTMPMTGDYYQFDGRKTAGVEDYIINRVLNPAWDVYGTTAHQNPANPADTVSNPISDTTLIYNDMNASKNGIYIGYIEHGEWMKSTVNVAEDGIYQIDLMVTAMTSNPSIMISALHGTDSISTGKIVFNNTGNYHFYQLQKNMARIKLKNGLQVIRTDITGEPPFNLWFYRFSLVE
ncbi:MAG TPA: carbohydrate-binding protein [Draconibacterium sp.]|nr:carbohydrate-binding protein [Draconibacterium sp.]